MSGNGGLPEYPVAEAQRDGLTKREAFAMAAMQGIAASCPTVTEESSWAETLASWSVSAADAILAELEKQK